MMTLWFRVGGGIVLLVLVLQAAAVAAPAVSAAQRPQAAQEEFVPIDELPPDEQLPAAPLLIAAYGFAWIAVAGYLWLLRRRLDHVERELQAATRRAAERERRL